jgi:hypothetical protein
MAALDVQVTRMQAEDLGLRAQQCCIGLAVYRRRLQAYAHCLLISLAVQAFNLCPARAGNHQHLNSEFPVLGISEAGMLGARPHSHPLKKPNILRCWAHGQNYLTAQGLPAVGNGQAACGFRVV